MLGDCTNSREGFKNNNCVQLAYNMLKVLKQKKGRAYKDSMSISDCLWSLNLI